MATYWVTVGRSYSQELSTRPHGDLCSLISDVLCTPGGCCGSREHGCVFGHRTPSPVLTHLSSRPALWQPPPLPGEQTLLSFSPFQDTAWPKAMHEWPVLAAILQMLQALCPPGLCCISPNQQSWFTGELLCAWQSPIHTLSLAGTHPQAEFIILLSLDEALSHN